jgi:hypothetical protein
VRLFQKLFKQVFLTRVFFAGLTVSGPKCYFALNKTEGGETVVANAKFKGSSTAKNLPSEMLIAVGERKSLLRERTSRIMRSAFGVRNETR